jgi:Uma2 family endonuclease
VVIVVNPLTNKQANMRENNEYTVDKEPEKATVIKEPDGVYITQKQPYNYADYLSWMDNKRRELINGVVFDLLSAPTRWHADISEFINGKLWTYITKRKGKCKIYHAPFDVRFPRNGKTADNDIYTVVQPDICVICDPKKLDDKGCIGALDLIVEVQSPSTAQRDLKEKFELYEGAGVREYWVVFPRDKGLIYKPFQIVNRINLRVASQGQSSCFCLKASFRRSLTCGYENLTFQF